MKTPPKLGGQKLTLVLRLYIYIYNHLLIAQERIFINVILYLLRHVSHSFAWYGFIHN
jgi:hypothetical protein